MTVVILHKSEGITVPVSFLAKFEDEICDHAVNFSSGSLSNQLA